MRILLADDRERVRYGLRILLEQQPDWRVIGETANSKDLLDLVLETSPDLVLLDWNLPNTKDELVLFALHQICQNLPVIVLSGKIEAKNQALEAGAKAFVSKTSPPDQLIETIQSVMDIQRDKGCEK